MTGGKVTRSVKSQSMVVEIDKLHTHSQAVLQSGAKSPATAKPEKKNKDISGGAKSDILSGVL